MKKFIYYFAILTVVANVSFAQKKETSKEVKYRRSSLDLILIESEDFPRKSTVIQSFKEAPFPDKYDNHSIGIQSANLKKYVITDAERTVSGTKKSAFGKMKSEAASSATDGIIDKDEADIPLQLNKFIKDKKIANQFVAKWFNRKQNGSFDMDLIGKRGFYNATEMETNIAKGTTRGAASLSDAGEELLKNTFVVFSKMKFISNEPVAAIIRNAAKASAAQKIKIPMLLEKANKAADMVYEKTKEGYTVWTTSYLYRLKWNDSVASVFYKDYWMDSKSVNSTKKSAFDNSNLVELEYVGDANANSLVLFSLKETRTEDQIIKIATVRNIDNVYAKLQKNYEVFKPKVPLFTGYPITAKIGMKEGLIGGEKFEVLEQSINEKTGLTEYKSKGKIKVDKKLIWDNRFSAMDAPEKADSASSIAKPTVIVDRTTFSGGKKYYSGMLIRQIK